MFNCNTLQIYLFSLVTTKAISGKNEQLRSLHFPKYGFNLQHMHFLKYFFTSKNYSPKIPTHQKERWHCWFLEFLFLLHQKAILERESKTRRIAADAEGWTCKCSGRKDMCSSGPSDKVQGVRLEKTNVQGSLLGKVDTFKYWNSLLRATGMFSRVSKVWSAQFRAKLLPKETTGSFPRPGMFNCNSCGFFVFLFFKKATKNEKWQFGPLSSHF